jgi:hypothetical protein
MRELQKGMGTELSAAVTAFGLGCVGLERTKAAMTGLQAAECKAGTWETGIFALMESRWKFEDAN